MGKTITLCDRKIIIRQIGIGKPIERWGATRYEHRITISTGGVKKSFRFYGSINDYQETHNRLRTDEFADVLEYILSDGISGTYTCKEFMAEFGYEDACEGVKAYKACIETTKKLADLGISDDVLYDMVNELNDAEQSA